MKVTGVPYEEIARAGGGIAASARALAEATDEEVLAQAGALAREMLAHGTTAFETQDRLRALARRRGARAARLGRELAARVAQPIALTALLAHAVPPGYDRRRLDGRGRTRSRAAVRRRPRSTSTSSPSPSASTHLARMGALARDARPRRCAPTSSSSRPCARCRSRWRRGARSVDHLACLHPDDIAPLAARRVRGGAAAGRRVAGRRARRARRARSPTRARSACSPPTATRARRRSRRCR